MTPSLLSQKIEALLFFKAEPMSLKKLATILGASQEEIAAAVDELEKTLSGRGVVLLRKEDEVLLGTRPDFSSLIEGIIKEELERDLGKAGLETLSIIIYLSPVSRADIDYIRGVSSAFILRNLLIRGLIERVENPSDKRSFLYAPSFDLLRHLGVTRIEELPEYEAVRQEVKARAEAKQASEEKEKELPPLESESEDDHV